HRQGLIRQRPPDIRKAAASAGFCILGHRPLARRGCRGRLGHRPTRGEAMERVDCVVVGAGVVGLAVARALALAGREVLILEAEAAISTGTSARTSEVIHAGIYYPPDSLKGRLCLAGRQTLYGFCDSHGVPYRRCGKLIVASDEAQLPALEQLHCQALANGVDDLRRLDASEVLALEPRLRAVAGLLSPSTGIIDSHALMLALLGDAERHGAVLALRTAVEAIRATGDGLQVQVG